MPNKHIEISMTLTERDWAEIYYAIHSKLVWLREGFYGEPDVDEIVEWMQHLEYLQKHLGESLKNAEVNY